MLSRITATFAALTCILAVGITYLKSTVWWAGYDLENCPGCLPVIDWSSEASGDAVTSERIRQFREDGVVVLP